MEKEPYLPSSEILLRIAGVMLLALYAIFGKFLPDNQGLLGRDFAVTLPQLLDGTFWHQHNSFFSLPWFTPSFCAGLPAFPNPGNLFYSIPQLLAFFMDPLRSVQATFYLFAILGAFGFYILLQRSFKISRATAWLGAVLFLFNDYYSQHMLNGQIACHTIMLTPWIAWFLTRPAINHMTSITAAALLLAYIVWSGAVFLALPIVIALMIIGITHQYAYPDANNRFWPRFATALSLATALSAAKWWSGVQLLYHLGPAPTSLSRVREIDEAIVLLFQSLFFPYREQGFALGITIVPLIMLVTALGMALVRYWTITQPYRIPREQLTQLFIILILALIPLSLTIASPMWDPILRQAPIFSEGLPLTHSWSAFISVVILWGCLGHDRIPWTRSHRHEQIFAAFTLILITQVLAHDTSPQQERYDPTPILNGYSGEKRAGWSPQIVQLTATTDDQAKAITQPLDRNNVMANGYSVVFCNEPLFGSSFDRFPYKPLIIGSVYALLESGFNMKNPACYLAPKENHCQVGDHFQENQREALDRFTHYQPFPFSKPRGQQTAEWISLASLILLLLGLGWRYTTRGQETEATP
ncbi:MAG: hypothetical protein HQL07_11570 [Nitrospirae bacterium]|nr:hypothetical protein [Magnetococcales bacterium]